jgi:3-methyladenine DNA glycosylase AlkD
MTLNQAMAELKKLGTEQMRAYYAKNGAGKDVFGCKMGDVRSVAKKVKSDHALAIKLWKTGNLEARLLATLVCKPKEFSAKELDAMVRDVDYAWLADWLNSYVVRQHPEKEALRVKWMKDKHPSAARAGWSLTTERVVKDPAGLDLAALLDRIERELAGAPELSRWTMNFCLGEIGINHPAHRKRAVAIGEKIGAYRDYPCSKGCTPPYVPTWVAEMVSRQP